MKAIVTTLPLCYGGGGYPNIVYNQALFRLGGDMPPEETIY